MADLIIPFDAKPDYDDWGPDAFWDLATWVGWHRGLKKKYGNEKDGTYPKADKIFLDAWVKQSNGASPLLAILQPSRFKEETDYIKKFPLLYQYTGLKRASEGINPLELSYGGVDAANSVIGGATATIEGVGNAAKILKYAIPVAMGLALVLGGVFVYKKVIVA